MVQYLVGLVYRVGSGTGTIPNVVDRHCFDAGPDPDSNFHIDADPDPDPDWH